MKVREINSDDVTGPFCEVNCLGAERFLTTEGKAMTVAELIEKLEKLNPRDSLGFGYEEIHEVEPASKKITLWVLGNPEEQMVIWGEIHKGSNGNPQPQRS